MRQMLFPENPERLAECLREMPESGKIICGGTDLIIEIRKGKLDPACLVDVSQMPAMKKIMPLDGGLYLGGACVFDEIARAPAARPYRGLVQAADAIGSRQIRNKGSIADNLVNHSPAGDMFPALLALAAHVHLLDATGQESGLPVEDFVGGEKKLSRRQAILGIWLPAYPEPFCSAFVKLGDRRAVSIARISAAAKAELTPRGELCRVRVALGAVGKTAFRARRAETLLEGRGSREELGGALGEALAEEIAESIPDRASLPYKKEAVKGLAEDLWTRLLAGGQAIAK